jgi:hypothetical protein
MLGNRKLRILERTAVEEGKGRIYAAVYPTVAECRRYISMAVLLKIGNEISQKSFVRRPHLKRPGA